MIPAGTRALWQLPFLGMARAINIVTSCVGRKRQVGGQPALLRHATGAGLEQRFNRWQEMLGRVETRTPARDLYVGEHWSVARQLPAVARSFGFCAQLWVCSAGYGLIAEHTPIAPYSATFTGGHPDSVQQVAGGAGTADTTRVWWQLCCNNSRPSGLAGLAQEFPGTPLIVAVSATYLKAIAEDLRRAVPRLRSPELLVVISAGTDRIGADLDPHLLPGGAELQGAVGGTLGSLNIRLVGEALRLSREGFSASTLRRSFKARIARLPTVPRPDRRRLDDAALRRFIRENASEASSHTAMLRLLRDSGFACEQSRFRELYVATVEQHKARCSEKRSRR